jgi:hypothetical protein
MIPRETHNRRNGLHLLDGRSNAEEEVDMTAEDEHSIQEASPSISSDEANYERLMKAFFRQPVSRIPIPSAWRNAALRAYSFRGPTSPFQNVATAPVPAAKRNTMYASFVYATEPCRGAASRISTPTPETTATPQPDATNESDAHPSIDGHPSGSALPRPSTPVPTRELENKEITLPGWSRIQRSGGSHSPTEHTGIPRSATAMSGETVWYDATEDGMVHWTKN